jgi:hypothetical protein
MCKPEAAGEPTGRIARAGSIPAGLNISLPGVRRFDLRLMTFGPVGTFPLRVIQRLRLLGVGDLTDPRALNPPARDKSGDGNRAASFNPAKSRQAQARKIADRISQFPTGRKLRKIFSPNFLPAGNSSGRN